MLIEIICLNFYFIIFLLIFVFSYCLFDGKLNEAWYR